MLLFYSFLQLLSNINSEYVLRCSDEKEERAGRYFFSPEKKELDAAAQKEIAGLLWKKILVKKETAKNRIAPIFYAPLDKLAPNAEFLAIERKKCAAITLKPTAASWVSVYHQLKPVLENVFKGAL